jgi:ABC-2 type transport system permease protein
MKTYLEILRIFFNRQTQYRAAAIAGLTTQLAWGYLRIALFVSLYSKTHSPQPMNLSQVTSYVWLGQAFFALMPFRPNPEIRAAVRDGTIAYELLRPISLYNLWFAKAMASLSAVTLLRSLPLLGVAATFFDLVRPHSLMMLAFFLLSLGLALMLAAAIATFTSATTLWTVSDNGISQVVAAAIFLFSGNIIPPAFFPPGLKSVAEFLPFRGILDTPFRIYLGLMHGQELIEAILHQAVWVIAIIGAGHVMLSAGHRRMTINGG